MTASVTRPAGPRLAVLPLESRDVPATGGGFTAGGILGEYFNNADLTGPAKFTRRDVRIDFDWQGRAPGGSTSPDFKAVGADNFSVRWSGQIVPRFSETYTFRATSDEGIRLRVRPADAASSWSLLIDHWDAHAAADDVVTYTLTAGKTYDIQVEYYDASGPAVARLAWSSPSTPEEVIEPATNLGVNAVTYDHNVYADVGKSGRAEWGDPVDYFGRPLVATDAAGWPTADAGHLFWEGADPVQTGGTYRLRFFGQAEVTAWMGRGTFRVNGVNYGFTFPAGVGYDPATNTTIAEVVVPGTDLFGLNFRRTKRTAADPENTGVTGVELMRPTAPGADTSYRPDDLFVTGVKDAFGRFTTLRYLTANFNTEREWADRKLPGGPKAAWADRAAVWEYEVLLANETGKDLYVTLPVGASDDYVRKLANLIRYGSDGVNPYAGPVADPAYPGLNPNLRVYVEWGNEVWNWAFDQAGDAADDAYLAVRNNTPDGQIINYDGKAPNGDFRRWAALRTVESSDIFRSVWGDPAMGNRVRVVYGYQYDNIQDTALGALTFLDRYFNNGDGVQHVPNPKPVNYYIWGAGGASYFGAGNPRGLTADIVVPGGTFENVPLSPGKARQAPAGYGWSFDGDAGVYREFVGTPDNRRMPVVGVGIVPATPQGAQALYVSGTGSAWVTINFPRAGVYALDFQAAGEYFPDLGNTLDFYFDDQRVTPNGNSLNPPPYPWWPGNGVGRDPFAFNTYGTLPVTVSAPGKHVFKIVGRGSPERTTLIDDVRVASTDAIFGSRVPAGGQAAGQVSKADYQAQLAAQARYAQAFGLKVVAYEGGWSLGGDQAGVPIQTWAKYYDPRTAPAMSAAIDAFFRTGGDMNVLGTYDQWRGEDSANAATYPIVQGIDVRLRGLPAEPTAGLVIPGAAPVTVWPGNALAGYNAAGYARAGDWVSWTVQVPVTADYKVTAGTTAGGTVAVTVDGTPVDQGPSGSPVGDVVRLTKGVHSVRVQDVGGRFVVRYAVLDRQDDAPPPAPTPGLPAGWAGQDVGAPDRPGQTAFDGTVWTVQGAGPTPWGTTDAFRFAHTALTGARSLVARLDGLTEANNLGLAGVMVRAGTGAGDPFAGVFRAAGDQLVFAWRVWDRGPVQSVTVSAPGAAWLKVARRGNSFAGYYSADGQQWTQIGDPITLLLPGTARAGPAVTSLDPGQLATGTFSNVAVV